MVCHQWYQPVDGKLSAAMAVRSKQCENASGLVVDGGVACSGDIIGKIV